MGEMVFIEITRQLHCVKKNFLMPDFTNTFLEFPKMSKNCASESSTSFEQTEQVKKNYYFVEGGGQNPWVYNYLKMQKKNTAKRNMSSAVCASSMYSRLCMSMLFFLFLRARAMPRMLYLSCGIPFPV